MRDTHVCQQIKSLNLKWVFSVAVLSRTLLKDPNNRACID